MTAYSKSAAGERGMTLTEVLISLLMLALMMIAFLGLLDSTSRVAKSQNIIADSTENVRFAVAALVRITRMAGTGGLPLVTDTGGGFAPIALEVDDNQLGSLYGGRTAVINTDVLRIRGAIVNPFYEIDGESSLDFGSNTLRIPSKSPYPGGGYQDLSHPDNVDNHPLVLATLETTNITAGGGVRHYGNYRVIEVPPSSTITIDPTPDAEGIRWMSIPFTTGGTTNNLNPGGSFVEPEGRLVYAAGFMDIIEFFIALNDSGEPSLYRTLGQGGNAEEVVPNIADLQVALGCDVNLDGLITGGEWFQSYGNPSVPSDEQFNLLKEVRITVVARGASREQGWEDTYRPPENGVAPPAEDMSYRYRVVTVRVALRSHPPLEAS